MRWLALRCRTARCFASYKRMFDVGLCRMLRYSAACCGENDSTGQFPRSILVASSPTRPTRARSSRGCHEDATKMLRGNFSRGISVKMSKMPCGHARHRIANATHRIRCERSLRVPRSVFLWIETWSGMKMVR